MERSGPMWWMRRNTGSRPQECPVPDRTEPKPEPQPQANPRQSNGMPFGSSLRALTGQLRNADGETLLLLGLIRLLRQEQADSKLLLALAYILL